MAIACLDTCRVHNSGCFFNSNYKIDQNYAVLYDVLMFAAGTLSSRESVKSKSDIFDLIYKRDVETSIDALAYFISISYGMTYEQVYRAAYERCAVSKGKQRHGDECPIQEQSSIVISVNLGSADGFLFQAAKKINEITKLTKDAGKWELLDAMVYIALYKIAKNEIINNRIACG